MTEIDLTYQDFPNVCRVCLHFADNLKNINEENMINLYQLLANTEIKEEDILPKNICKICRNHLHDINLFIEKCKSSNELLKKIWLREQSFNDIYDSDNCSFAQNEETGKSKNKILINDIIHNPVECKRDRIKSSKRNCSICGEYIIRGGIRKHYRLNPKCRPDDCKCSICGKAFYPKNKLLIHLKSHKKDTPFKCPECSKSFSFAENLRRHALTHSGVKPFTCDICEKGFLRKRSLDEHMNFHTGRTPYICVYCGNGFKRLVNHAAHIYRIHSGNIEKTPKHKRKYTEKRVHLKLECKICGKLFASRSGYANHQLIHKGEKKFLCNICGKKFITNPTLQSHIRTHTGEKPFECNDCGKIFSQRNSLNVHMSRHITNNSLKCPKCDKKYFSKSGLNNHLLSHTSNKSLECPSGTKQFYQEYKSEKPHQCNLCSKSFMSPSHLNVHLRTHSGEKPYTCTICGKQLAQPQTLKVHMRQHTGETPYVCSVCEKGFHDSTNLRRHFNRHHANDSTTKNVIRK